MSTERPLGGETLATITVSFNPDTELLAAQLRALPVECAKLVVDNASCTSILSRIRALVEGTPNATLLCNASNVGLPAAINMGVMALSRLQVSPRFVLLLDQDSEPGPGSVQELVRAFVALESSGRHVGCVGPVLKDSATGLTHGFHQCTRWRWRRVFPPIGSPELVRCMNLNGSGTLIPLALFDLIGGLEETFFIDHVDTEWAFRVMSVGFELWGVPTAVFAHQMGERSTRFWWFGWRVWPSRSPRRHYFLFRNAVALLRREYVPLVWKFWAVLKLLLTAGLTAMLDARRGQQLASMWRGLNEGLRFHGDARE